MGRKIYLRHLLVIVTKVTIIKKIKKYYEKIY